MTDPYEQMIATVVDAEPLFADPVLDAQLLFGLTTDVAEAIHPILDIAKRYGFATPEHLVEFITKNREVRRRIKAKRANYESNVSIEIRNRNQANHVVSEAMGSMAAPLFDKNMPAATRLDVFKAFSRIAGVDGNSTAASQPAGKGEGGNQFVVNFMFSGQQTQTISATVVEAEPDKPTLMPALDPAA